MGNRSTVPPAVLRHRDAAVYLAVSDPKLEQLVADGLIPTVRIDGHRRYRVVDLDSFVASRVERQG